MILRTFRPISCQRQLTACLIRRASSTNSAPPPRTSPQKFSTPLAKQLYEAIQVTGPVPIASFMRQCLTSPDFGYYTEAGAIPFGPRGDFVTSPEISQMFGEMLALWIIAEWMNQGLRKEGLQLIELGPGKGTLMEDVLRVLSGFSELTSAVEGIYLVEASETLRNVQRSLLCGPDSKSVTLEDGGIRSTSRYSSIPITWYPDFKFIPKPPPSAFPFVLAHEFFDALPIHAFEASSGAWRELLVSCMPPGTTPEFALTRAKAGTPHSMLLPELSDRYKALRNVQGAVIEISPESQEVVEQIAKRIGAAKAGGALIIDYGPQYTVPMNSLRGIRKHKMVDPFIMPGQTDISADVDFVALAERALDAHRDVEVHGPVEQGDFLSMMGMKERLELLVKGKSEEEKIILKTAYNRLVAKDVVGMGNIYKAMAIVPERGGKRPVGFGGGVNRL